LTAEEQRRVAASVPKAKASVQRPAAARKQAALQSHPILSGGSK
jgi:hypothetical protein